MYDLGLVILDRLMDSSTFVKSNVPKICCKSAVGTAERVFMMSNSMKLIIYDHTLI